MPGISVYLLILTFILAPLTPEQHLNLLSERSLRPPTCFATPDDGETVFDSETAEAVQLAINAADSGAVVKVAGTCLGLPLVDRPVGYPGSQEQLRSLVISKTLQLEGGYTVLDWQQPQPNSFSVIDAQQSGRSLTIVGAGLVIVEQMTFLNGDATGLGGTDVAGLDLGGGVYISSSKVALHNTLLVGNHAPTAGGGLFISDAAVFLSDSELRENSALRGGGIWTNTTMKLIETQIISNTASGSGGAIYLSGQRNPNIKLTLEKASIHHNQASDEGGGIFAETGLLQGTESMIEHNESILGSGGGIATNGQVNLYRSSLSENVAAGSGGAIFADSLSSKMTLFSTNIVSNTATAGGGVYSHAANFVLRDVAVRGNTGAGVYTVQPQAETTCQVEIHDSEFDSNIGGGLLADGCYASLDTVQIKDNHSTTNELTFGGIKLRNTSAELERVSILSNTTSTAGGGVFIVNESPLEHTITLDTVTISHNQAGGSGGGLALQTANRSLVKLHNVTMGDNTAQSGGAVDLRSTLAQTQRSPRTIPELQVTNTIISQATSACSVDGGTFHDAGWNLISDASCGSVFWRAIELGPLVETDSRLMYHELIANSPAIDAGICIAEADQRGYPRPSRRSRFCDIGAIESERTTTVRYRIYFPTTQR